MRNMGKRVCSGCGIPCPDPYESHVVEVDETDPNNPKVTSDWDDETETHWIEWDEYCGKAIPIEEYERRQAAEK